VRVVADTHALSEYLLDDPDRRLSDEAAATDGVVVSVASVVDLWYVIRTRRTFTDDQLGELVALFHDPGSPLEAAPVTLQVAAAFSGSHATRSAIRGTASSARPRWRWSCRWSPATGGSPSSTWSRRSGRSAGPARGGP
jgi:predicted nucleic acid-binding protein